MDCIKSVSLPPPSRAPLPPEAPLEMPAQDLRRFRRAAARRLPFNRRAATMRLLLILGSLGLTAWFAREMYLVLALGDLVLIEGVLLGFFVVNIGWICFNSVSAVLGLLFRRRRWADDAAPIRARTAILVPTYNEDPAGVVGVACATLKALEAKGQGERFDVFILSDTNRQDVWLAEQAMVDHARASRGLADRLFYRHRSVNRERKVGNIADWVTRWGGAYEFMVVFDADSLMDADTILTLVRRAEARPEAGLIQTVPQLVGARTPLALVQQFAGRVYGPSLSRGIATWFGNAGNFWGHNAVIRTRAFAASAGLPHLPGRKPFGGLILSHDFVEAALLRRAGWAVLMAEDLGGSFERAPPNLVELASRDRRWAQGNLQHLALLRAKGLHPISRLHMAMGAMAYAASPLWLIFLLVGMALALYANLVPPDYFPDGWALFPTWPQIDAQRAITLFGLCLGALYLPKAIGALSFLGERASRGQRLRILPDVFVEVVISALTAPILMLTQTRAVFQILVGGDSGWGVQARDADRLSLATLWQFHKRHMLVGVVLAAAAWAISWSLLAWMSPALVSMLIALPLGAFLGATAAGRALRRMGLLSTPEERRPPAILLATAAEIAALSQAPRGPAGLVALVEDPAALSRHLAWLDGPTERKPGDADPVLAAAWLRLADGARLEDLGPREAFAVLASSTILDRVIERPAPVRLRAT